MAIKPFEIQSPSLVLAGVQMQAGATGVVIPGVTQATSYTVEETNDTGDQTVTWPSVPTVIDNGRYAILNGGSEPAGYVISEYVVEELDGDQYITEVQVTAPGSFPASYQTTVVQNMWATTVADPFTSFNAGDWTQIPFAPVVRAGEIENLGGNTSQLVNGDNQFVLESNGNLTLPDVAGVSINYANGQPYGGGGSAGLPLANGTSSFDIATADGNVTITADTDSTWTFATDGSLSAPGAIVTTGNAGDITLTNGNITGANNIVLANNITTTGSGGDITMTGGNIANVNNITRANAYTTIFAYGTGGHGGPELDWSNADSVGNSFENSSIQRNVLYLNGSGLYVGINAENNANIPQGNLQFDGNANLIVNGNINLNGNIHSTDNADFQFTSNISDIALGTPVTVTLADAPFGGPISGQVSISGVTGTTQANGVWYYQAVEGNQFDLYNDAGHSSPVDGATWTAYVSGGVATSITAKDINIVVGDETWTFDPYGNITLPGNTSSINYANGVSIISGLSGTPNLSYTGGNLVATANFKLQGEVTGLFVETYATNLNYNVAAINSTGDSDGNTYIVGYQSDTNRYYVQAIDPTGVQSWIVSVEDFVGGGWYPQVNAIAYNANNSTIDIGFYYYDGSNNNSGSASLSPSDGSVVSSRVLESTPTNASPNVYAMTVDSSGNDMIVGRISGEFNSYANVTTTAGGKTDFVAVPLSAFPAPFSNYNFEIEITPGTWIGQNNINYWDGLSPNNINGSGTGMSVGVNWENAGNTYSGWNGSTNPANGYVTNDILQVPGSNVFGTDNTNINAVTTSYSVVGSNDVLVFDKATYPGLSAVAAGWYIINLNVARPGSGQWSSGVTWGIVTGVVDTGSAYEITLNTNGGNWDAGAASLYVTGGGNDVFGYVTNNNYYGNTYTSLLMNSPSNTTTGVIYYSGSGVNFATSSTYNFRSALNTQAFIWTPNWQHTYGGTNYDEFTSVAYDSSNSYTYLFGDMYGTVSSVNYRNNLIALDSSGNTLWSKYTENANQTNGQPGSVCAYNGYVYTVGVDNNGYTVVTKLNSSGALQWQALETDASNWDNSTPYGCVDSNGDVYVSGSWNASNYVYRIIKLSGVDGTVVWARTIGDTLNYSIYNGYNDTVQNTTAVGTEIFASFYGYDTNNSNNVAISVKLPADGSGLGTYGRWIYAADSAEFSDNTSNAAIISNTLGTPTDQTTQSGSSYNVSVGSDIGGYTANIIETISAGGTNIIFSDGSTQSTAFTGSTAILENGTSNVTIPTANGNVLFSLNDGGMSWNFSTDGYIYSKENYNFTTVAVDNGSYNNVNQRVVTPGGSDYASTQLSRNNFNIYLDQQGSYYQWSFNNDRLYTPQTTTGKIQAYNNAVQVQSMMAGNASAVASLQSISNSNDPNVLTSIDATTTGANIVVWNGGSVGGTANTWTFNNLGSLTVPGPVVGKANSTLTLKGSAPAVTGQFATATTAGGGYGGAGGTLALFQSGNFNSGSLSSVQAGNVVVESNGHTANIVTVTPNYASTGYTAIILDSAWSQSPPFTFYAGFGPSGNVKVQIDSNNWIFDNAGNLTAAGNVIASNFYPSGVVSAAGNVRGGNINTAGAVSATGNIYAANLGNISSINLNGNSSQVLYGNGVFSTVTSGYGDSNVTTLLSSFGPNTISTTGNVSTGNAIVSGTSSNIIRRAFGLVAADTYVQLDDIKARVTSSTSQLSIILASGSWQGTGWTETFTSGSISVSSWVNLPLSSGYDFASGAMNSQGNGCRCVISDQTPTAKVYEITVVRSGTSGTQWNISIERLV